MQDYTFSKAYKRNHNKKFIIIVDDDKNIRFILKTLFAKSNTLAKSPTITRTNIAIIKILMTIHVLQTFFELFDTDF